MSVETKKVERAPDMPVARTRVLEDSLREVSSAVGHAMAEKSGMRSFSRRLLRAPARYVVDRLIRRQSAYNLAVERALHAITDQLAETRRLVHRLETERYLNDRGTNGRASSSMAEPERASLNHDASIDYFGFEQRFRGPRQEIKHRQEIYLPHFLGRARVLDIGCGRGEFLELLQQAGVSVYGIDIDEQNVHYCRQQGFEVYGDDALQHLSGLPDASLGGIFSAQVVEHLAPAYLTKLLHLCDLKLQPGGILLMETINPGSLYAVSNAFYADLSHVKLLHPQTLRFLLESAGFTNVQIGFISPVVPEISLHPINPPRWSLPGQRQVVSQINHNIDKLNGMLFGYQDYFVVGTR